MSSEVISRGADARSRKPGASRESAKDGEGGVLRHYRLAVASLKIGMWVAELDRPWLDTPFLIQGFRIDNDQELETLQRYCRFVFVDIEKSDIDVAEDIRSAEIVDEPVDDGAMRRMFGRATQLRSDARVSAGTRARFRRMMLDATLDPESQPGGLKALVAMLMRLLGLSPDPAKTAAEEKRRRAQLRKTLPPNIKLRRYQDARPIEEELPRARKAFDSSCDAVKQLLLDIRGDRMPDVVKVHGVVDEMVASMIGNPDALMWVARLRDEDVNTYSHSVKVALYMIALGRHLGFPKDDMNKLGMVGMLADVGKTKLPRALLDKPGMLTPQEYTIIKEHVRLGLEALKRSIELPEEVEQGISQHHERLDGSGYPHGLKGEDIGIYGRIAAIADSFAALITPRAYANANSPQDALMNLFEWAGSSFHEPLVEQFVQAIGIFPVGSFVELSTGEAAIIIAHNRARRLEPKVLVLTWPDKRPMPIPIERNLIERIKGSDGRVIRIVRGLPAGSFGLKMRDYYGSEIASANGIG